MTIDQARKHLGNSLDQLNDNEVERLITSLEQIAEIIIDTYVNDVSNLKLGVIDSPMGKEQNGN